jgi:chromosome segregation ATPase
MTLIPAEAKKKIDLFLMQDPEDEGLAVSAPEANGYEFQSQNILEIFEKLLDKFIEEKTALEKKEANGQHAYSMLVQDLKSRIALDEKDKTESSADRGNTLHNRAADQNDRDQTFSTEQIDTSNLQTLKATCAQKASEFEARQQLRTEELQALQQAVDIMSSGDVSGHAATHLPSLVQTGKSALAHLRADSASPAQMRAVEYLQKQAGALNSRVLSVLAARAQDDPFTKVKKMIKDLVVRLMEEANDEAEHKGWCDTELASNQQTREEKTSEVETLHAQIDELEASIAKISEDIQTLTEQVADTTAEMAEATKIREDEKSENAATVADAKAAQTAVAQAMTVLNQFYEQAGEATAFVQSPYQGMQSENTGVIGMMEVIESDFARLEADTEAEESSSQKQYDDMMTKSSEDKAVKNKSIEHKEGNKQDQEQELSLHKADLEGTQKELDAALSYYDKLKPSCVDAGVSFEDRVARRKEEVESLQEALKILNGEDIA